MRILHITPDYYPAMGGGELYIQGISERLARRHHDVIVLAMNSRGLSGTLVTPEDPEDLAKSVIQLLSDHDSRGQMGRAGHAKTVAHFTWDKVADKVECIYKNAHAGKDIAGRASAGAELMNRKRAPRVSIIVPAYNAARYVRAALQSVLEQTCRDYEIIVVDDGSTDNTKTAVLAVEGPISYIHQPNQGPSAARNTGIVASRGALICFLDADDLWTPDKLNIQLEVMERNPRIGLVFSDEDEFDEEGVQCASLLSKSRFYPAVVSAAVIDGAFQKLLHENFIPTSTVMVRRQCFETTGLFDVMLKGPEDRDMWSRIAAHFPIACVPRMLGRKRVVPSSVSRDVETTLRSRVRLWHKARDLFPELASERTVNALLAPIYVQLGFLLLDKDKTQEARESGLKALKVAREPSQWLLALSLLFFSFTGRAFANSAFRAKRWLLRASAQ